MIKIMLHSIIPNATGGPNVSVSNIYNSDLNKKVNFSWLIQKRRLKRFLDFDMIRELKEQIEEFEPDIVHISGLQLAGFYAVNAARKAKCKPRIIVTVRGSSMEAENFSLIKKFLMKYIFEKYTLKNADAVYTVCKKPLSLKTVSKYPNYIGCIHNLPPILGEINTNITKISMGLKENDVLVSLCSRMVYDKGITFVLDIIRETPKKVKFIFIGDGVLVQKIEKEYTDLIESKKIIITNKVKNPLDYINASDIFLFPTLHENLSNSLLEACSLGKPVIATNVGGNSEIVHNGYNGFLIEPKNSQCILNAINNIIDNKTMIDKMGRNSLEVIDKEFSSFEIQKEIYNLYERVLK